MPVVLRFPADAAEFTFKFGTDEAPTHPQSIRAAEACERIKRDTNGRVEIQFFPGSQLGGQAEMFSMVRSGAMDFLQIGDVTIQNVVPVAGITNVAFAYTPKNVWTAMDGALGAYTRAAIEKLDLRVFDKMWDAGFREVSNNVRPIVVPDDLKGIKLRIPGAPILVALFKALGASPTPVDVNELYAALQTHLVDGLEVPLISLEAFKFYEVTKYVSFTDHVWTGYRQIANGAVWRRLPKNLQDIIAGNFDAMAIAERNDLAKLNQTLQATLTARGLVFNRPDITPFRERVRSAGLYAQWKAQFGDEAWTLLENAVGKLV